MTAMIAAKLPPFHPRQHEIATSEARFRVAACGRRFGKTRLGAALCLMTAAQGGRAWWVAPTYKVSEVGWRLIHRLAVQLPGVDIKRGDRTVTLPNGGEIAVRSADNPDSLRGEGLDFVVFDECAFIQEAAWSEAVRPALSDRKGKALFISTPKGRNWFWQLWQRCVDAHDDEWEGWQLPTVDNPYIDPSEIEAARRGIPERIFQQEYLAMFLDDAGGVFRRVMDAATAEPQDGAIGGRQYVMGIDWGRSNDFSVIAVIDMTTGSLVYLDRFNQIDYTVQRGRVIAAYERFQPAQVIVEVNAMGQPVADELQRDGLPVMGFTTTNASKAQIIDGLALAFERGTIRILNDPILIGELQAYEMERTASGLMRYCFVPGTPIQLSDGCIIPIEGIQYDYAVITHKGVARKVNKVMERDYVGDVVSITASGLPDRIVATPEHPFWAKKRTCKHLQRRAARKAFPSEWIRADELNKGDWLAIPKRQDLPPTSLTPEQLYVAGYWLAEGSISYGWKRDLRGLSFVTSEMSYLERIQPILRDWFPVDTVKRGNNLGIWETEQESYFSIYERNDRPGQTKPFYEMAFYSRPAAAYFLEHFGQYANGKALSSEFFNQSGLLPLVSGHLDGDGSQRKNQQRDVNIYTSSEQLAWQLRQILIDNHVWCTLRRSSRRPGDLTEGVTGGVKVNYQQWVINIKASFLHLLYPSKIEVPTLRHLRHVQEDDCYFYTPIRETEIQSYDGKVYNFSVDEDNSYVAGGVAVHNCHDDTVMALAMAWHGATETTPVVQVTRYDQRNIPHTRRQRSR